MKMLNKFLFIPALLALGLLQVSCKKGFLEIEPKGYVIAETTKDYEQLMNATSLLALYAASLYLGDEIAAQQTYMDAADIRTQRIFRYEDRVYNADQLPSETWHINTLYTFNKVINEVMQSKEGTDQQKRTLQAEAKVGRAICHLYFLSDYSMPYNAATAATDPGVPILTQADVTQTSFVRAPVQEVYEFMIRDLTEALPDLGALTHRRKLSKITAEFFLGRIYLYMANFTEARKHIDAAFAEISKSVIPLALYDYNVVLDPGAAETWLPDFGFGLSNKPLSAENTEVIYNINMNAFQLQQANTYVFSPQTADLFDPLDKRLLLYSGFEMFNPTAVFPKGMRRYSAALFTGIDVGPTLPDLYLMRAELKARANDLAGAKEDLELLRNKRMPASAAEVPANIASDQQALVKFVLDERIREFAISGMRWLDMRRLSVDPVYSSTVKYTHELYDGEGNVVETYILKPERFALKFGERMLDENQGLTENP